MTLFLGAGASAAFKYPTTNQLFERLQQLAAERGTGADRPMLELREALSEAVRSLRSTTGGHLPPLTDFLSLLDFAIATDHSPLRRLSVRALRAAREAIERDLQVILEQAWNTARETDLFKEYQSALAGLAGDVDLGVVTTNYDTLADEALFSGVFGLRGRPATGLPGSLDALDAIAAGLDFGFQWREPHQYRGDCLYARPAEPRVRLFKLHGSVNWLRCELCEHVFVNLLSHTLSFSAPSSVGQLLAPQEVDPNHTCWCGHHVLRPLLVAPSTVRDVRDVNLLQTWQSAFEWMRRSDRWIFVGYSLPVEDLGIRSLIVRARDPDRWNGETRRDQPRHIEVISRGDDARARWLEFLPRATYDASGFRPAHHLRAR